jgi:hypothetical protein
VHVSVTRANHAADEPAENATIVAEEMTRWLRDIEGFEGFVMLTSPGTTIGLSFWESGEVAERHKASRLTFIERMTSVAGVEVESTEDFTLAFAQLSERLAGTLAPR